MTSSPEALYVNSSATSHAATLLRGLKVFLEIIKFRITVLVTFTTGLGYILAADDISFGLFYPITGIFLLASAASALNHYQERETDSLMKRTMRRPIPLGRVKPQTVLIIAVVILLTGSVELLLTTNLLTTVIGLVTFFWYNGVYTPLKKKTAWAIIPGSLVGALPPIAGWTAAGGNLADPRIFIIALYFFVWQIPHFWLLLMLYADDYRTGGFPTLNEIFTTAQLKRITFSWLTATVLTAMSIPMFGLINYGFSTIALFLISVWMSYNCVTFLASSAEKKQVAGSFMKINFYTLLLITVLSLDKFLSMII
jgi:protoheme IX farnesyltransferase